MATKLGRSLLDLSQRASSSWTTSRCRACQLSRSFATFAIASNSSNYAPSSAPRSTASVMRRFSSYENTVPQSNALNRRSLSTRSTKKGTIARPDRKRDRIDEIGEQVRTKARSTSSTRYLKRRELFGAPPSSTSSIKPELSTRSTLPNPAKPKPKFINSPNLINSSSTSSKRSTASHIEESEPRDPPLWLKHRQRLQKLYPLGWAPPKRLSRESLTLLRDLHRSDPDKYNLRVLCENFKISPEAVRRILKSRFELDREESERREIKRREERERKRLEGLETGSWKGDAVGETLELIRLKKESVEEKVERRDRGKGEGLNWGR